MVACRFYIQLRGESSASQILGKPGGLIHAQTCSPAQSFADIKQKLWSKKNLRVNSSDYVFKLANAEATFDDQDPFAFFLFLNDLFREAPTKQSQANNPLAQQAAGAQRSVSPMPGAGPSPAAKDATPMLECVCLHRDDLADKSDLGKRQSKLAGVLQHQGPLSQRQDGLLGASWKERWGVVQDFNLFLFESEQAYTAANMSAVTDFFPLGCMIATRVEPAQADKQHPFCFELLSSRTPSSGSNRMSSGGTLNPKNADHKPNHFYTDSESSLLAWIGHINRLYLRRLKLMVLMAVESLDSRGLGTEGLFRISGNKTFVEALQLEFESGPGRFPNLDACDEHTITGTLKSALRNLPEPLLTFDQYPAFIRLAHDHPSSNTGPAETEARIEALRLVVARLPESNQGLLEFLMCFLARVADRASVNKMTPGNLSIVFTPNILRPRVESVTTVMQDAKAVLDVVEQMITHARTLWPQAVHTRRSLRANPLPAVLSPKSKGLPAPATGGIARPTPLPPPAGVARPTPLPPGKMPPPLASVVAPAPVAVTAATPAPVPVAAAPAAAAADPSLPAPPLPAKHKRVGSVPPPLPTTLRAETSSAAAPAPAPAAGAASPPAAAASSPGGNSVADRMRMFGSPRGPPPLPSPSASAAPSAVAPSSPAQQRTPPPPPAVAAVEVPVVEAPAAASPTPPAVASAPVSPASSMVVEEQPVLEVPRELLKMSRQTNAMGLRWSESMASAQRAMAEALAQLLDAHAALRDAGAVNHEAATSTVTTVQSCMEVLTSDLVSVARTAQVGGRRFFRFCVSASHCSVPYCAAAGFCVSPRLPAVQPLRGGVCESDLVRGGAMQGDCIVARADSHDARAESEHQQSTDEIGCATSTAADQCRRECRRGRGS